MPPKPKKKRKPARPKPCQLCKQGIEYIDYKDLSTLKPFLNERAKIKARRTTGACAKHQAKLVRGDQERPRDGADPVRRALS